MKYFKIPKTYQVGGQTIEVRRVERCSDNTIGECCVASGYIEIADLHGKDFLQSQGSKENTFYHELVHSILRTMGETEINDNEKFVCCFSSFLTEAMKEAYFIEEDET